MSVNTLIKKASNRATSAADWMRTVSLRLRGAVVDMQAAATPAPPIQPTIRQRQEELASFYTQYESLVEILCDAAQYGPNSPLEAKYAELRDYMQRTYPEMRKYVIAYLDVAVEDAAGPLDLYGHATDAYEALFAAPTLQEQIRADDGNMIGRIMRTREALNRYAENLRRLAA